MRQDHLYIIQREQYLAIHSYHILNVLIIYFHK